MKTIESTQEKRSFDLDSLLSANSRWPDALAWYAFYFGKVPNQINEENVDAVLSMKWLEEQYKDHIITKKYYKRPLRRNARAELYEVVYQLKEDILVNFDAANDEVNVLYSEANSEEIRVLVEGLVQFSAKKKEKTYIHVLKYLNQKIYTWPLELDRCDVSLEDNYNDDLLPVHETIKRRLSTRNDKGIVILHGKPGTGKTSYMRYVASMIDKPVIYLPPNMAESLTSPEFISTLASNRNSILLIEDAEKIVVDRNQNGESAVSTLLNLSDGLLSDALHIQIVCSFNTDLSRVDKALLRKGRLIAKYEFDSLNLEKTRKLAEKLGYKGYIDEPKTLTEIFNLEDPGFEDESVRKVGFQTKVN